jgi:hypothetical protein
MTDREDAASRAANAWEEIAFSATLALIGVGFICAALLTRVEPDAEFNARTLPLLLAAIVAAYGAAKGLTLYRVARGTPRPALDAGGLVVRIVIPLSAAMVLYVPLVEALGYGVSTVLVLIAVLWIFGVRGPVRVVVLAVVAGLVANYAFIELLRLYMPDGWLVEAVQGWLRAG